MNGDLRVTRTVVIPADELSWRFTPSGGPGGQHANRSSTRAEVTWNVKTSTALGPRQRERLIFRLGNRLDADGSLHIASARTRSQLRNREDALQRLLELVREALRPEVARIGTQPTKTAKERRLQSKRRRGAIKQLRQARFETD